ncbi:hypothetical protein ACKXGF_04110 [Alkalibacillus sp. S2W]|uniref:hypothetical protein n=1 Tax=Alkalibacillus sp. S2W TaxID=3386553 RepID=UPI00398CD674
MIHYHSRYYIHGHTDWQLIEQNHERGNQSAQPLNVDAPLSEQDLIQFMGSNKRKSQYTYRTNKRQTWLKHFRTSKPLPNCKMRQPIKIKQTDVRSVLMIDSSRSMRQGNILEWIDHRDFTKYHHIFLHRENLYPYPHEGLTEKHLEGGTSFIKPVQMLTTVAKQCNLLVHLDHVTDGHVGEAEQTRLNDALVKPILSYRQIKP